MYSRIAMTFFLSVLFCMVSAQNNRQIDFFPLSSVRLLDGPFLKAQNLNMQYILQMDPDRLLVPYRRESGLPVQIESYPNWENTGLDGHIGGHYLSALSLMYASTHDSRIKKRLDYMIDALYVCQKHNGNGYLAGIPGGKKLWSEIKAGNIQASRFELNGKWVPLYNIHKVYAGLRDAWFYADNAKAKKMLIALTDWILDIIKKLTDEQIQEMLVSEHGGLNEIFADVATITGRDKYLDLAVKFSDRSILCSLMNRQDSLTGLHANTQLPKIIGFKRIAEVSNKYDWDKAAAFFWKTVVENRTVCIGGNSVREHFHAIDDFSPMIKGEQGVETCNTYNMLRLSRMLFHTSGDVRYMDYYERALYNHILSSQNPNTGGLVYFTQMRPGHYRVYSQHHTSMWCCVGTGIENHSKYGEMIYAHQDDDLFVNLFIPSVLSWKEKGIQLRQETKFPYQSTSTMMITADSPKHFMLHIRKPVWATDTEMEMKVNGKKVACRVNRGYISIERTWKAGDLVEFNLPMKLHAEGLPDKSQYVAFAYGPIVLASKTGNADQKGLYADDSRMGHVAKGTIIPLSEMPILVTEKGAEVSHLTPDKRHPLTFRIKDLYPKEKWKHLELIPFFSLHESRYIIYWHTVLPEEVDSLEQKMILEEKKQTRLNNASVDVIYCGQQQPESDHRISYGKPSIGYTEGYHWRDAKDWFCYQMSGRKSTRLYLKYLDSSSMRHTEVSVNGIKVADLSLSNGTEGDLKEVIINLPATTSLSDKKDVTVRFSAKNGMSTFRLVEVRLLDNSFKL